MGGDRRDFVAVVDQVIALLRQRSHVAYRTLQRHFQLDDAALEDLKIELIDSQRLATDEQGTVLVKQRFTCIEDMFFHDVHGCRFTSTETECAVLAPGREMVAW
jgi:hypothetical protein